MMRSLLLFITWVLFAASSFGQKGEQGLKLQFEPIFQDKALTLHEESICDTFPCVSAFKTYLSHFELLLRDEVVWSEADSYHLIDAADSSSLGLAFDIPNTLNYDRLRFHIGIDSLTSVSGAFGADLDPTKGMYWTWNSGYIFFKMEGKLEGAASSDNSFEFHLGGYQGPNKVYEEVSIEIGRSRMALIHINLDSWLSWIDLQKDHSIMSPGPRAQFIASLLPDIFKLQDAE